MSILAIDYGTKNIGLALSDDTQKLAFQYNIISVQCQGVRCQKEVIEKLKNICQKENVKKIIIGLPVNLSGKKTQTTGKVENFIKLLKQNLKIDIQTIDERLSTVQALKIKEYKKTNVDELSAQILLQSYLEKN